MLAVNGALLNTYFTTLQPIEFTAVEKIATQIKREEETGEKLSSDVTELCDDDYDELLGQLEGLGEVISDDWEVVHTERVDDPDKDFKMPENLSDANPNKKSAQDKDIFKVRYAYMPVRSSGDSRKFCKRMETFTRPKRYSGKRT